MAPITILTEAELRKCVPLGLPVIAVVEEAFRRLASGKVVMPPILSMELGEAHGETDVKTAYLPGFDNYAVKVASGFFDNPKLGLPSGSGLMILLSAKTGVVTAVLLDNGYLTDIRTAAAGAVAAKYMAPKRVETAGVLGTGAQARLQIIAAHLVRPFTRVVVWGRERERAEACAKDIAAALKVKTETVDDAAVVVRESQLVVTATAARKPILRAEWMHTGLHITAMGSDQPGKNEIDPRVLMLADLYVCDSVSQVAALGELRAAHKAGLMTGAAPLELGSIVAGENPGRPTPSAVTICDLTGTGAQDTAIASYAYETARKAGIGTMIRN
jgi:ornithine cyclodeaminase